MFAKRNRGSQLSLDVLAEVAKRCALIETLDRFRRPMDIEWTVDHEGEIFMLQARPIVHRQAIALKPGM
jgi:phosphoenolpyruvate synthase/pyruvate phosphate dikinase